VGDAAETVATGDADDRFLALRWSPKGTFIGWTGYEELHLMNVRSKEQQTFPQIDSPIYDHDWSPDESILYASGASLYRLRSDGSDLQLLDASGHSVSVDPTTGRVAWVTGRGIGRTKAIVSKAGGSDQRVVLTTAPDAGIDGIIWSPAGRQFLFVQYGN
jgi:hypothetical protein